MRVFRQVIRRRFERAFKQAFKKVDAAGTGATGSVEFNKQEGRDTRGNVGRVAAYHGKTLNQRDNTGAYGGDGGDGGNKQTVGLEAVRLYILSL